MSQVVYKYGPIIGLYKPIKTRGRPVHFEMATDGKFYVWCVVMLPLVREEDDTSLVAVYPTGEDWVGDYIGTVVTDEGFVWHAIKVFE